MRFTIGLSPDDAGRWAQMWTGLAGVGDLANREVEILADVARRDIAGHFESERSPEGIPWAPLAPMTQRQRKWGIDQRERPFRVGAAHPILVRTRDLKLSLTDPHHPRNVTDVHRATGLVSVSLGAEDDPETPARIATLHGGGEAVSIGRGAQFIAREVPARPFMGLSETGLVRLERQTSALLDQRLERI